MTQSLGLQQGKLICSEDDLQAIIERHQTRLNAIQRNLDLEQEMVARYTRMLDLARRQGGTVTLQVVGGPDA